MLHEKINNKNVSQFCSEKKINKVQPFQWTPWMMEVTMICEFVLAVYSQGIEIYLLFVCVENIVILNNINTMRLNPS